MIMAGQGTAALELLEEVPRPGRADHLRRRRRTDRRLRHHREVHQPEASAFRRRAGTGQRYIASFAAGERVEIPPPETIADGLRSPSPGKLTFPIIQKLVEGILLVSEDDLRETMILPVEDEAGRGAQRRRFDRGCAEAAAWHRQGWRDRVGRKSGPDLHVNAIHPVPDPRQDLIADRARHLRNIIRIDPLANQRGFITRFYGQACNIDRRQVHRDRTDDRRSLSSDHYPAPVRQCARYSIRIARRDHRHLRRPCCDEPGAIAHRSPVLEFFHS